MVWRIDDPQGNEASKCKYDIPQYLRGIVLDLGCGPSKVFPHAIGVDSCADTALFGIQMKPDVVVPDCTNLDDAVHDESVDTVFSSHLLEHIADYQAALASWWKKIKVGGYLVLYLPHALLYPRKGTPGANPDHKHDFLPHDIIRAMQQLDLGFDLLVNEERNARMEYSFLQVYKKREDTTRTYPCRDAKPAKTVLISRFGGFGDMLQTANLLPQLKREGYHITINTTPKGQEILKDDPHVDDWLIVDTDLIPNPELPLFWEAQARRYDKFVQLSESIEGTLLAMPGRANYYWPLSVRRREMNKNYLEWVSALAEIPYLPEAKFYPAPEEVARVEDDLFFLKKAHGERLLGRKLVIGETLPDVFLIQWVLAGSSCHKFYPGMDAVIARVMLDIPEALVLFNGDEACEILECGWENEPRVIKQSGKMPIRESLTQAQRCDLVLGPETGVMNAVAFEPMAKVLLLSHSSKENLSRDWVNTVTLEPIGQHCFPCHELHYGSGRCDIEPDTGAAMCQIKISPDRVWHAIHTAYRAWKRDRA